MGDGVLEGDLVGDLSFCPLNTEDPESRDSSLVGVIPMDPML